MLQIDMAIFGALAQLAELQNKYNKYSIRNWEDLEVNKISKIERFHDGRHNVETMTLKLSEGITV